MADQNHPQDFTHVDQATDPGRFVRCLDGVSALAQVQAAKRLTFDLLQVQPGHTLLDVGCGTGDDVLALAARVGPSGRVVGVDSSHVLIAEAQQRASDVDLPVEYRVGDALELDFPDDSFDGCRANRVLMHVAEPRRVLAEMYRVSRAGAFIVCFDRDWESLLIDATESMVTRKIMNYLCDRIPQGWMGRQLPTLFRQCGLVNITVVPDTLILTDYAVVDQLMELRATVERLPKEGILPAAEATMWLREQEQRAAGRTFFMAITGFAVCGRKP